MDLAALEGLLEGDSPFRGKLLYLDTVGSTNDKLKELAAAGAPQGTVVLAGQQTAGRGTRGRAFASPPGMGLYLSVLLRPQASPEELLPFTGWVAVAVREGIADACAAPCRIKWLNDIYLRGRKLAGILTELRDGGLVIGIGVNLTQTEETFAAQGLEGIATSLALEGYPAQGPAVAAAILNRMARLCKDFPARRQDYLEEYRAHCLTLGRQVADPEGRACRAVAVDRDFALVVEDGQGRRRVRAGSVRLL